MTFRLRHRAVFDPLSITHTLRLRAPRLKTPHQWHWAWPLHHPSPSDVPLAPSPVRHVWVSAIRVVAVSDDAAALAFVSHHGAVALAALPASPAAPPAATLSVAAFVPPHVADWCTAATSVAFFRLAAAPSAPARALLAVGYHSGAIAVFDVATATPLAVTRPYTAPVRRLRYYPAFHLLPAAHPYPVASENAGLLAVYGWSGVVARLSSLRLLPMLSTPPSIDPAGAPWLVWNLPAQDAVLDAVACGSDPASICDVDPPASAAALRLAAVGLNPPIAAYSVTSHPAFSARAAAKRAATTVFSAAKGFLLSRIAGAEQQTAPPPEQPTAAVTGVARHSASWADDPSSVHGVIDFGNVRDTARKSVTAVLQRGRRFSEGERSASPDRRRSRGSSNGAPVEGTTNLMDGADASTPQSLADAITAAEQADERMLSRQRSDFDGSAAVRASRLPQNARIVERVAAAPLPCSLLATCDTLGRIFLQDPRDLCVLRVLKGYRDAQVAWMAQGGPLLVVYAPRLNVLELHGPLEQKRREAFRLLPGSMLTQTTSSRVCCISPDGNLYELTQARKGQTETPSIAEESAPRPVSVGEQPAIAEQPVTKSNDPAALDVSSKVDGSTCGPDYELVGAFTQAVKSGHTSRAVECLQRVEDDAFKVAHLMATLVACTAYIRTEVHVALASKASQIASKLKNPDLLSRFEAHRRLAEAYGLLAADAVPMDLSVEDPTSSRYGRRLIEDDIGTGLAEFAVEQMKRKQRSPSATGRHKRGNPPDTELINCERFILSHSLAPTLDLRADVDYELHPRSDLSKAEQLWLAKAYFSKLLEIDSVNAPTPGREYPTTADVFLGLTDFVGLSEAEITRQFVLFFLHTPLLALLNTYVSLHASPLRCAVARLRSRFPREVVDPILLDGCETTSRIPNAVLLIRLCAVHEGRSSSEGDANPFLESLDRLGEVLLYRKMIAGSAVPPEVYEKFTARRCTGVPGDAERHAVTCLIDADDFARASKILEGLHISRKLKNLDWHESASVSEAALHASRKKAVEFITDKSSAVIPHGVVTWILAAGERNRSIGRASALGAGDVTRISGLRAVLLSAHQYIPDSSVDAVRCLQLAEAMSALLGLEAAEDEEVAPFASQDLSDMDIPQDHSDAATEENTTSVLDLLASNGNPADAKTNIADLPRSANAGTDAKEICDILSGQPADAVMETEERIAENPAVVANADLERKSGDENRYS